jgi:Nitrile hydratase, alpha chain/Nitrile hydratase beta subunit
VCDDQKTPGGPAPVERRVAALERAFEERNLIPGGFIEEFSRITEEDWVPANGAKVIARAWTDAGFRRRLLENGKAAVAELGFTLPDHHKHLVVPENTPSLQNVICCTLCSCTAFTIIGLPPGWYKDFEYRSTRVKNEFVSGHVRMPGYIRGKIGIVVAESPPYPFPDAAAHNLQVQDEPTYDVRFKTEDLWPQAADEATVHVAVFQSYLEKAP